MVAFFTDLFTPETWKAFQDHGSEVSGFRERQRQSAARIDPGDLLCCYLVRLSRWCGLLEVVSGPYVDATPIFSDPDPYNIRFKVRPLVVLEPELSIPIFEPSLWSNLSVTRDLEPRSFGWAQSANLRSSLRVLAQADGQLLKAALIDQGERRQLYPLTQQDRQRLAGPKTVRATDRAVLVEVPVEVSANYEDREEQQPEPRQDGTQDTLRQSLRVQASLAKIGIEMGFRIWIPRNDKQSVLAQLPTSMHTALLDHLPLNYDDVTLKTIEQIDVIWLRNRSMARAFEVEHTTAIYSGILRMADLLALQPNMDIRVHIVAPDEKREKVLREIKRPVFSLLDRGPLYESCSFLPYTAVDEIAGLDHLRHTNDTVIDEFVEEAEDE